jgi:hypothetical protein
VYLAGLAEGTAGPAALSVWAQPESSIGPKANKARKVRLETRDVIGLFFISVSYLLVIIEDVTRFPTCATLERRSAMGSDRPQRPPEVHRRDGEFHRFKPAIIVPDSNATGRFRPNRSGSGLRVRRTIQVNCQPGPSLGEWNNRFEA